jgi:hypothetical protein
MQILLRNDSSHIRHEKYGALPKEASSNSGGNDGAEQLAAALNTDDRQSRRVESVPCHERAEQHAATLVQ